MNNSEQKTVKVVVVGGSNRFSDHYILSLQEKFEIRTVEDYQVEQFTELDANMLVLSDKDVLAKFVIPVPERKNEKFVLDKLRAGLKIKGNCMIVFPPKYFHLSKQLHASHKLKELGFEIKDFSKIDLKSYIDFCASLNYPVSAANACKLYETFRFTLNELYSNAIVASKYKVQTKLVDDLCSVELKKFSTGILIHEAHSIWTSAHKKHLNSHRKRLAEQLVLAADRMSFKFLLNLIKEEFDILLLLKMEVLQGLLFSSTARTKHDYYKKQFDQLKDVDDVRFSKLVRLAENYTIENLVYITNELLSVRTKEQLLLLLRR